MRFNRKINATIKLNLSTTNLPNQFCHNDKVYENKRYDSNRVTLVFRISKNILQRKNTHISKHYFDNI